jgi:hypothetical protein
MMILLVITFVMNQLLTGSMTYMNAMIRSLQITLHLPMMRILFPANVMLLCSTIIPVVMFDVLENPDFNYETFLTFINATNVSN